MIIQCLLNEWMDFYLHYPSPSLSLFISFFLNDRNRPSIGALLWIPLHPEPFLPVPTQSYHGLHGRAPRGNEAAQRSPLILLLSLSKLTLGYPLDKSWDRSGTSRPPLPWIHPQHPQLLLHTNGAPLTQQLDLPLLFLSFPPSTGTRKDLEPLAGLQGNNSIIDN